MPCRPLHEFHVAVAGNDHAHRDPAALGPEQFAQDPAQREKIGHRKQQFVAGGAQQRHEDPLQPPLAKPRPRGEKIERVVLGRGQSPDPPGTAAPLRLLKAPLPHPGEFFGQFGLPRTD